MNFLFQYTLACLAKAILRKYNPDIIGITGSVGKTSTKDMVALVLSDSFRIRASPKTFNNEFGVPLTIIGYTKNPGRSLGAWLFIFFSAFRLLLRRESNYPEILVLEMGANAPGDIDYLTRLAPCRIGIITALACAHLEGFETFERIVHEKKALYRNLHHPRAWVVVNADDPATDPTKSTSLGVRIFTFGKAQNADMRVDDIQQHLQCTRTNPYCVLSFSVRVQRQTGRVEMPEIIGAQFVSIACYGISIGLLYGIALSDCIRRVAAYQSPPGRMRLLPGIKHTYIIDDTYNASPSAMRAALDAFFQCSVDDGARKIAALGDMAELGTSAGALHRDIGEYVASCAPDALFTIGPFSSSVLADAAVNAGLDREKVFRFNDESLAARALQDYMKRGDLILVKGSQAMRLERVVKEIMDQPERAHELLVRQEKEWQKK